MSQTASTRIRSIATALALFTLAFQAQATIDTTDMLPKSVNNTQFRYGVMDGADKKFDSSGSLVTQLDANTVVFDAQKLATVSADFNRLVAVLNQSGHANYGSQLNMGALMIDSQPDIRYFAPVYARGITPRLTLGFAVPVIHYKNNIAMSGPGSNIAEIHARVGYVNQDVEDAFAKLELGTVYHFTQMLQQRGYKPITNRDESLIGDAQLVSLYKLYDSHKAAVNNVATLTLPTGKADDPDDLADLGTCGDLSLEEGLLSNYWLTPAIGVAVRGSYKFIAPRKSGVRVPVNADDALPDSSRKDNVMIKPGDVATVSSTAILNVGERLQFGSAIDLSYKQRDQVSGGSHSDWDYSPLTANSEQTTAKVRLGAEYFTTTAYTRGHAKIPFKIAYEFANVFSGKNVLNTTVHEFGLSLFF